jgi:aromatic ring hydroxylase
MSPGGTWAPLLSAAYRVHSIEASDRAERTMEGLLTSYLILTGGASDLSGSEIDPLIERYFRGGAAERFIPTAERLFGGYLVLILAADPVKTLRVLCQDRFFVILA